MEFMKKVQSVILGLVVLLAMSCSKEDNKPVAQTCSLLSTSFNTYEYNPQGKIKRINYKKGDGIDPTRFELIDYNSDGKISKFRSVFNDVTNYTRTFEYNSDGFLLYEKIFYGLESVPRDSLTYSYDNEGILSKVIQYGIFNNSNTTSNYSYPSGDKIVIKNDQIIRGQQGDESIEEITLDNKKKVPDITTGSYSLGPLSEHNLLTTKWKRTKYPDEYVRLYFYKYNASGYPIEESSLLNEKKTVTNQFTYSCQ